MSNICRMFATHNKTQTMLENFLQQRITALENQNTLLREREVELTGFIYELIDRDTPQEYREVIRQIVFNPKSE